MNAKLITCAATILLVVSLTPVIADEPNCSDQRQIGHVWLYGTTGSGAVKFAIPFCSDPVVIVSAETDNKVPVTLRIDHLGRPSFNVFGCISETKKGKINCAAPQSNSVRVHWIAEGAPSK